MDCAVASLLAMTEVSGGLPYPPNTKPRLHAFIATVDPRIKMICSNVRVEKNVRMLVM
jgi:hypothetical protein